MYTVNKLASIVGRGLLVVVLKKNELFRFCVHYQNLHALSKPGSYQVPRTDKCLASFEKEQCFPPTTLRTRAFGLRDAPETFQRAVNAKVSPAKWQFALVYLENIVEVLHSLYNYASHVSQFLPHVQADGVSLYSMTFSLCTIATDCLVYVIRTRHKKKPHIQWITRKT